MLRQLQMNFGSIRFPGILPGADNKGKITGIPNVWNSPCKAVVKGVSNEGFGISLSFQIVIRSG